MDAPGTPPGGMPYGHLEQMLKETFELTKENNKILKRMERNAIISFVVKIIIWLLVLGVPIFFLSSYLGPLMSALQDTSTAPVGVFGLPSSEQLQQILDTYNPKTQP